MSATQSHTSSSPDAIFREFTAYNWDKDQRFQQGLQSILTKSYDDSAKKEEAIEKAKCFYYSKFFRPINYLQYLKWKTDQSSASPSPDMSNDIMPTVASQSSTGEKEEKNDILPQPSEQKVSEPQYPRSFQELCEMVARGEEVPGIRTIPNKINEAPPSESHLAPRRKPWETKPEGAEGASAVQTAD
ncbi:uncharacterized protein SPPG_04006 [Spizellomyces punctatus DAOM BR117]|uniref:Uncharacterized protein n=1 Tax=Spizellomyces punctatus (strain DAOM BR117) TaxID=645134 RepID=A0A0L0HHH1_SPIPD|nr:uncharacterized protein SPPG_04006 [Spizellomyces punctatus DAOM BR117]KND00906.1 hypothetical protein SPPG_04006 [Spizellomyces punctatus DAOM BR117]|eukprot:XP_016608945.1 hypothetical protein SPPG_04006 [Spizellomyces punctatus DAOM BR117]